MLWWSEWRNWCCLRICCLSMIMCIGVWSMGRMLELWNCIFIIVWSCGCCLICCCRSIFILLCWGLCLFFFKFIFVRMCIRIVICIIFGYGFLGVMVRVCLSLVVLDLVGICRLVFGICCGILYVNVFIGWREFELVCGLGWGFLFVFIVYGLRI